MNAEKAIKVLEKILSTIKSHKTIGAPGIPGDEEALNYAIHCCKVVERIDVEMINKIMQNCLKGGATTLDFAEAIVRELKGEE